MPNSSQPHNLKWLGTFQRMYAGIRGTGRSLLQPSTGSAHSGTTHTLSPHAGRKVSRQARGGDEFNIVFSITIYSYKRVQVKRTL